MGIGLHIELEEVGHQVILRIDGRLDAAAAPLLEKKLLQLIGEKRHILLLDMSSVEYMSSGGIRVLLAIAKKLQAVKGDLSLFSLTEEVEEMIKEAGFERILHIFASEKEALKRNL